MKKSKRAYRGLARRNAALGYLFTFHWLIGFLAFTLFPLVYSLYMSFHKVSITGEGITSGPVGLANYFYAFTLDFNFIFSAFESIKSVAILTPLIIILALILALLLNQRIRLRGIFRAVYFLPVVIISGPLLQALESGGAFDIVNLDNSGVVRWLSQSGLGIINDIVFFLIERIFTVLWFSGVQILIYLSGLQKNSKDIYEAARIDGATSWQTFWNLTFPAMNQFTILNVVYTIVLISTFATSPVMILIRDVMFRPGQYEGLGYASAVSWIYFVIILLVMAVFLFLVGFRPGKKEVR